MALTSLSFIFLSLFAIHEVEATWAPAEPPPLSLSCSVDTFDLTVTYAATTSADYAQSNDLAIGDGSDAANCAVTGTSVDNTAEVPITKSGVSYGDSATPGCGAGVTFTNDATKIEYVAPVKVTVSVTKDGLQRVFIYEYTIKCTLTRSADFSTSGSYTVSNTEVTQTVTASKDDTFDLAVTLEFIDGSGNALDSSFPVNNDADLSIRIQETPASTALKFTVQRCFASTEALASASGGEQADIISNTCPVDNTITLTDTTSGTQNIYTIGTRAFTIAAATDGTAHYLHCNIFVCLEAETTSDYAQCAMDAACPSKKRKRRSVVNVEELERVETITSIQTFTIIDDAYTTDCPEGHVFDTLSKLCTQERVFKIEGVHLDKQWDPEYANISSTKFQWFAKNTAREIRSLIMATGVERQIRGIKVIAARPGSVILTVLITYGEEVEPREAFEKFKNMLWHTTPQVSRLVNVLNVIKEKTVELVPVEIGSKSSLDKNFIIVTVFAVVAVLFISAITLYQVQKIRRTPPVTGVTGIDNSAMEKA